MSIDAKKSLPGGWARATIRELVGPGGVFIDGDWVESKDQDPDGDVRLIQLADVGDGKYQDRSSRFLTSKKAVELRCTFLERGDVLIARMPDPLGRSCIYPGDSKRAVTVVDVCIVRTGRTGANHRWLTWAINSPDFKSAVAGLQSGSTRKRISRGNLATLFLPIAPLAEQTRIAEEIEKQFTRLDAAVAALKRVQANLKRYRAAVLKAACEGRLVTTEEELARCEGRSYEPASSLLERISVERRSRWEAAQLAKSKALHRDPENDEWKNKYDPPESLSMQLDRVTSEGWGWATVDQLTTGDRTSAYGVLQPGEDVPDGVLFIRVGDIDNGRVAPTGIKRIAPRISAQYPRTILRGGEVLITLVGAIGRTAVVPESLAGANTARAVGVIPVTRLILARWLELWLRNPQKVSELTGQAHEVARKTLNLEDVRRASVALPPVNEQERIAGEVDRRFSVVDEVEAEVEAGLKRADRLRQAILKIAFEGKLVPQNPNDEPASVLLERIRTDRVVVHKSSPTTPRRRRKKEATHVS